MTDQQTDQNYVHSLEDAPRDGISAPFLIKRVLAALAVGIVIGYIMLLIKPPVSKPMRVADGKGKMAGISDKKTFKDQAEGFLKDGGLSGEGTFHLDRPGGVSQNVYLTSSTVDLSGYVDKKVRVWGETFKGQKAAWLMDVGLIELLQ